MSDEVKKQDLNAADYSALVLNISSELWDTLFAKTTHLGKSARWLVIGRVVSRLFQSHFRVYYDTEKHLSDIEEKEITQ